MLRSDERGGEEAGGEVRRAWENALPRSAGMPSPDRWATFLAARREQR
jgi:hypothetical protein